MTMFSRPSVGVVLTELGPDAQILCGPSNSWDTPVVGASIWSGRTPSADPEVILVVADGERREQLESLLADLPRGTPRIIALTSPSPIPHRELADLAAGHTVVEVGGTVDPAEVVLAVSRAAQAPADSVTRRLTSLQRSLTQALGATDPLSALLGRLRSTTNAHVALLDKRGRTLQATGPVPLSLLSDEISRTDAESQMLDVDGWHGIADKIHDPDRPGEYIGWLIATSRRPDFPDQYGSAAVHVAASLVEACHRMTFVARQQERAIKAAVLEEALALRRDPDDPELAGRIAGFGLNFDRGVRVAILRPLRTSPSARGLPALEAIGDEFSQALRDASVPHLLSRRERHLVVAAQCSPAMLSRVVVAAEAMPKAHIGVGRAVTAVGDVPQSHSDAALALRTLQRSARRERLLAYEDFDFATRLFSEVGIERMTIWASDFLRPVVERPALLEGLSAFFKHEQNMNTAAHALSIHHNSLRYRLAKVEELLKLSLRDPAAFSSLFLALTALEHDAQPALRSAGHDTGKPADIDAPHHMQNFSDPSLDRLGVILNPDGR